ncbi:MAG TPA: T9SS type A sorting domain-containing protein [Bacteroidia bacterium]|jgi:hypothetical protein|nr:T9SS type A sorting domain-containing protein [Bacteroidia bacterium]
MKKQLFLFGIILFFGFKTQLFSQAPSVEASNTQVSYKWPGAGAISISWTRGNGQACMVVVRKSSSAGYVPASNSTNYTASANYGSGSTVNGTVDNYIVYKGTSNGLYLYGLTPNTTYDAYVYEYNLVGGIYYYNTNYSQSALGFATIAPQPSSCGTVYGAYSITNSSADVYWTAGSGDGRLITIAPSSTSATNPAQGYYYSPSATYGAGAYVGGAYAVYEGTGTNVNVTGLAGATNYTAYDYEYADGSYPNNTYNYDTRNYLACNTYTFNTTNIPPTINAVSNDTVCQDIGNFYIGLSGITDGSSNETQNVTITATSSNHTLMSDPTVYYSSPNTTGYLYPAANAGQYGTTVITLTVDDGWSVNNITTTTFTIVVLPTPGAPGAIVGNATICGGLGTQTYSIAPTANTTVYNWIMPTGFTITSATNTNVITVSTTTATTSGTIIVYSSNNSGCGNSPSSSINVQVDAQPADPYAGPDQPLVCGSSAALSATAVSNPDAGVWSWYSGTPVPSIGTATVNSTSISGLTGPNNVYKYIWTVTRAGSSCPAKTDTVVITTDWNNAACQPAAAFSYGPTSDAGNTKVCVNTQVNFTDLSVSANSWSWNFNYPSGTGTYTSSVQSPAFTYTAIGTYTVHLQIHSNATGLNYSTSQVIDVIGAPATPGMIFGTTNNICAGSSSQYVYSISGVTDATGYNWTIPTNAHINAYPSQTSIAVSYYNHAQSGNVTVSAKNSCGTSGTSTLAVTVSPLPYSSGNVIAGPATVCQAQNGVTYTISPAISGATSYVWTDLNGTQTTTTNTFSMNIGPNANSGQISVMGSNACGTGDTVVLNITVNHLPGHAMNTMGVSNINLCPNPGNVKYTTTAITNASNYHWSLPTGVSIVGGNNKDTIIVHYASSTLGGSHEIIVYGSNSCGNGSKDSVAVQVKAPLSPQICMVTVDDSSTHNIIYWDKTNITGADSFRIYREDVTNIYHQIGTVNYHSLSEFHDYDPVANPNVTTKRYKISSIDSCGIESAQSPYHNTIYITSNGSGQFSWVDLYTIQNGPNPVNNYVLMVDSLNNGNWVQRASTAGTQHVLNDIYYSHYSTVANWHVETVWNISCTASSRQIAGTQAAVIKSKSNIINNRQIGIKNNGPDGILAIYPNPTNGNINLNFAGTSGKAIIKITNMLGQEVYNQTIANVTGIYVVDLGANESGTFIIQVITNKGVSTQKIIKQ